MSRYKPLVPGEMNLKQRQAFEAIASGPRGKVSKPLQAWLQVPEFAQRAQLLGEYCRFHTSLGPRLVALVILEVSAHWRAQYEWEAAVPVARDAGIAQAVIDALWVGRRPAFEKADEAAIWMFTHDLLANKSVSPEIWDNALGFIASEGIVELIGVIGYFCMVAMTVNAFEL